MRSPSLRPGLHSSHSPQHQKQPFLSWWPCSSTPDRTTAPSFTCTETKSRAIPIWPVKGAWHLQAFAKCGISGSVSCRIARGNSTAGRIYDLVGHDLLRNANAALVISDFPQPSATLSRSKNLIWTMQFCGDFRSVILDGTPFDTDLKSDNNWVTYSLWQETTQTFVADTGYIHTAIATGDHTLHWACLKSTEWTPNQWPEVEQVLLSRSRGKDPVWLTFSKPGSTPFRGEGQWWIGRAQVGSDGIRWWHAGGCRWTEGTRGRYGSPKPLHR